MDPACTRDNAERIARAQIAQGDIAHEHVFTVRILSEIRREVLQPPMLYGVEDAERTWIVYVSEANPLFVLKSSRIIVVSKADGSVKYSGSAHDEG